MDETTMIGNFPALSSGRQAEISAILKTAKKDSRKSIDARNELVLSCIPLAKKLAFDFAHKYGGRLDRDDLVSVAVCAMYDIAYKFDSDRGAASTFFTIKIKQSLYRYYWHNLEVVRLPSSNCLDGAKRPFAENVIKGSVSLSYPSDGHKIPLANYIADYHNRIDDFDVALDEGQMLGYVKDAMIVLDNRERSIIHARYFTTPRLTLEAVSGRLGITKERVRQIEATSIGKLKQFIEDKKIDNLKAKEPPCN